MVIFDTDDMIFSSEEILIIRDACIACWATVNAVEVAANLGLYEIRSSAMYKIGVHAKMSTAMDNYLEEERRKWLVFDMSTLFDRLGKIKNGYKLRAFIIVAQEYKSDLLYSSACERARELGYGWIIPRSSNISKLDSDLKRPKPIIRKIRF